MIQQLFPRNHLRYTSLEILGQAVDPFTEWLFANGFTRGSVRFDIRVLPHIERQLQRQRIKNFNSLTWNDLEVCSKAMGKRNYVQGCIVRTLRKCLVQTGMLRTPPPLPQSKSDIWLEQYEHYLNTVRGLQAKTARQHIAVSRSFLLQLSNDANPSLLQRVCIGDIERFLSVCGKTNDRASLQHIVAELRALLRYSATQGLCRPGLDSQIDTPRLYRMEQLPRALPWETVIGFLKAIDQGTPLGIRDYTMFFLILTYGLRAIEVVNLTFDDIHWRSSRIRVPQKKTQSELFLPLTDDAASVLIRYIRKARPSLSYRQLFLRARAPYGLLKPTALADAVRRWSRLGGLNIPGKSVHWLRHSYAVHLLKKGVSIKAIGDVLGHRNAESTSAYLRLATEDLRRVPLSIPSGSSRRRKRVTL